MLNTYTARYTRISSGYMGQLVEWAEVITEGETLEDCREFLHDAVQEMIAAYRQQDKEIPVTETRSHVQGPTISCDQALQVARCDAEKVYRDLSFFRIEVVLEEDGWHIDYELRDPNLHGGGPHYVIDAHTGAVVKHRYEQ